MNALILFFVIGTCAFVLVDIFCSRTVIFQYVDGGFYTAHVLVSPFASPERAVARAIARYDLDLEIMFDILVIKGTHYPYETDH